MLPTGYRHDTSPTVCQSSVGWLVVCLGQNLSADCWPSVGWQSTNRRPTVDRQSVGGQSGSSRPTDSRQSADRFFGELFFTITVSWRFAHLFGVEFLHGWPFQVLAIAKHKVTSVFYASVLLLMINNCVITWSKFSLEPLVCGSWFHTLTMLWSIYHQ